MTPWIIGNWKLNPTSLAETQTLVNGIVANIDTVAGCHLMVAPSFVHLGLVAAQSQNTALKLASQDTTALTATYGAYTGDVSAAQLKESGVESVIIGHSERRQYYSESNDTLLHKLQHCAAHDLGVIFCIGESEAEFEAGQTQNVLAQQLAVIGSYVQSLNAEEQNAKLANLIIAYEPVWAIGTGKVPSVQNVDDVHTFVRQHLLSVSKAFTTTPIIYGGSVKPENAAEFASCDTINGVLVGGAALEAGSFLAIAKAFSG